MRLAVDIVVWSLAAVATYFTAITIAVTAGTLYSAWVRRRTRAAMDDAQTLAFSELRHSLRQRVWGIVIESACQASALVLQTLHTLHLLPMPAGSGAGTPVLVLPGYSENAGNMWWLGRRLSAAGFNPILLDFPSTTRRIEENAKYLGERIAAIRSERRGEPVAIVAHSMGGLVSRTLVHSLEDHGVCALVAIASPFRGTHLAAVGARLRLGHSVSQMSPKHDFFVRFPPSLAAPMPLLSMIGRQETIVAPEWTVVIAGAEVRVFDEPYGHMSPLFSAAAFSEIEGWLLKNGVRREARGDAHDATVTPDEPKF